MIMMNGNYIFHVHTYRCGHAEHVPDEAYIIRALQLGASDIWFSDHAPFPGDPFRNRMRYEELPEYIDTLQTLKRQYTGRINIHIGLETEYLPSFDTSGYYKKLMGNTGIEFLLLGQHMAELGGNPVRYTFSMDKTWLAENEYKTLGDAIVRGIETGYFDFIAHPDRIFRRCKTWTSGMSDVSSKIIQAAKSRGIPLEQNEASMRQKEHFWPEFWMLAKGQTQIIHGLDAHFVNELHGI